MPVREIAVVALTSGDPTQGAKRISFYAAVVSPGGPRRRAAGFTLSIAAALLALGSAGPAAAKGPSPAYEGDAYYGLAAWIDMYDAGPWEEPERTVADLARRGVRTLFVQTSNYRQQRPLHRPAVLSRLLAAADHWQLRTVGWYLPGFDSPRRDWHRVKAAVTHASASGHSLDGFALDIEATAVPSIATRNRRMLWLSRRLRWLVGDQAALGAIIPDPVAQQYWPGFPYREVDALYDVFLPMAYWTGDTRGAAGVHRRTRQAIALIRGRTGNPSVPVHVIGGLASYASAAEVRGFVQAAIRSGAAGASLYDAPITSAIQWQQLRPIGLLSDSAVPGPVAPGSSS